MSTQPDLSPAHPDESDEAPLWSLLSDDVVVHEIVAKTLDTTPFHPHLVLQCLDKGEYPWASSFALRLLSLKAPAESPFIARVQIQLKRHLRSIDLIVDKPVLLNSIIQCPHLTSLALRSPTVYSSQDDRVDVASLRTLLTSQAVSNLKDLTLGTLLFGENAEAFWAETVDALYARAGVDLDSEPDTDETSASGTEEEEEDEPQPVPNLANWMGMLGGEVEALFSHLMSSSPEPPPSVFDAMPLLTSLTLSQYVTTETTAAIVSAVRGLRSLRSLTLDFCMDPDEETSCARYIPHLLAPDQLPHLTALSLKGQPILGAHESDVQEALKAIGRCGGRLRSLTLDLSVRCPNKAVQHLEGITGLTRLELLHVKQPQEEYEKLPRRVAKFLPNLTTSTLSGVRSAFTVPSQSTIPVVPTS